MRKCQYCGQRATHGHTPTGETYTQYLCEHHYWKCFDYDGEDE